MKKLFALLILLVVSVSASTVPFTAHLQVFTSTPAKAYVVLTLKSASSCLLSTSTGTISQTSKTFYADVNGAISDVIIPNTEVMCNGYPASTWYNAKVYVKGVNGAPATFIFEANYNVDTPGLTLETTTPISATPPAPVQDYAVRNGDNVYVGGIQDFTNTTVVGIAGTGGSTSLKTNGVSNSSQTVLDVQNGTGTTATNPSGGIVKINTIYGSSANTAAQGNDSRLSDARTPTSHATSHASGGTDPITLAESQITNLPTDLASKLSAALNLSDIANAATARTNLGLGTAATINVPASGNAAVGEAVKGSDTRLTDARTPNAHAASHGSVGSDPLTLAESQITSLTIDLGSKLAAALNLSDIANAATARTNLGLTPNAIAVAPPDCHNATTSKVLYTSATNTYSCGTDQSAAGGGTIPSTSSILKGDGAGNASAAVAGTDFAAANASTSVNGVTCTLGSTCTVADSTKVPTTTAINGHPLSSNVSVTASDVGLSAVTNDAQTKAAVIPNTAPSAGQFPAGNAGGTAYAPVSMSGDATLASTGALTLSAANKIRVCEVVIGDPGSASLQLADDNDSPAVCANKTGATLTITAVECYANAGSPTVTPIITGGGAILTGALTCGTGSFTTGTLSGTPTQANNGTIDANITVAGGTAKYIVIRITRTL